MFERVIKLIREEKVSLFIGSGFSYEAQAPSVRKLCEAILSQFDDDEQREEHMNDSLADLSNFYVEEICSGSRNSLIDLLQKEFIFTPAKMVDHQALAKIPHFHNIFTTNYDTLLEDSYETKDCQVIRKDADCAYIDETKPVRVFKIHGDFVNQDFVVITSNDYNEFFNNRTNPQMWDVVKHDFLTKHINEVKPEEIIIATNPKVEGDIAYYTLLDVLNRANVEKITRIAYGLPVGGSIVFADKFTLHTALEARRRIK